MNETEVWVNIAGYEGFYQVSDLGRVRSMPRQSITKQARYDKPVVMNRPGRILKVGISSDGYPTVMLCRDGKPKNHRVHRLVAIHFIDNHSDKPAINHIDFNRTNNRVSNLEWCTIRENNLHSIGRQRKPSIYKSTFCFEDRAVLNSLFDAGVGVTAIAYQLDLPYHTVRYIYKLRNATKSPS